MPFVFAGAENLKRSTAFPVKVARLYAADWKRFQVLKEDYVCGYQEITLRYDSDSSLCMDKIDGRIMGIRFPNVVFKFPGMRIRIDDDSPRSAIGFSYSPEVIELLRAWKMFPEEPFLPLPANAELKRLIGEFLKFTRIYPTLNDPGDRIDGICFDILREIMRSRLGSPVRNRTPEVRIKEAELYFQHHYDERPEPDAVAKQFGFSHTSFYQYWRQTHSISPHRYVNELKLRAAALALLRSGQPISEIAARFQFPGTASFHRKFRERFQATPAEVRRNREFWEKKLPELFPE